MEISDKSEKCIHCGYPIRSIPYLHENINGKDYDVSFLLDNSMSQVKKIKQLTELSGCDLLFAKQIVLKYCPTKVVEQKSSPNYIKGEWLFVKDGKYTRGGGTFSVSNISEGETRQVTFTKYSMEEGNYNLNFSSAQ